MVEGPTEDVTARYAASLAEVIGSAIG